MRVPTSFFATKKKRKDKGWNDRGRLYWSMYAGKRRYKIKGRRGGEEVA